MKILVMGVMPKTKATLKNLLKNVDVLNIEELTSNVYFGKYDIVLFTKFTKHCTLQTAKKQTRTKLLNGAGTSEILEAVKLEQNRPVPSN